MDDLIALVALYGVPLVLAVTFAARIGAPVPASPLLIVVGALSASGRMPLAGALAAAIVGNILGDAPWFWAGRRYGYRVLRLLCRISMSPDSCVRQSESFISRWGGSSLIAAKFVPGISVVAPPMAGALGMSNAMFLAYETIAAAIWAFVYLGLGFLFSDRIQQLLELLSELGVMAGVVMGLALLGYVAWRFARRRAFLREVEMSRISVAELRTLIDGGHEPVVIDVRSDAGRAIDVRRIPGAFAVELAGMRAKAAQLPHDREIVLYCNCPNEASAARAARILAGAGLVRVRPLAGGLEAWAAAGHAVD
jgi:membrane protein DedA with SNARE-associated domain/rhodanese-related sulfurtransferase